ncbi:MAG TPA: glycine cleavage system protein GcvH [Spirochaeta sp.]|nr:glycine cleavage system protein GcvH [Spirochaeta sp.]
MEAEKLLYTREHEWIAIEGNEATIGITEYAQEELGDIVFVELPPVGDNVDSGDSPVTLESVKAVSSVYAPFAGEVIEVNVKLDEEPELINSSPLDDGWIIKLKITGRNDDENFLNLNEYNDYIKELD